MLDNKLTTINNNSINKSHGSKKKKKIKRKIKKNGKMLLAKKFSKFLNEHVVEGKGAYHTHVTFGEPWKKYKIEDNDYKEFMDLYCALTKDEILNFIERPKEIGPLLIDIDFRFSKDYEDRQYTEDHYYELVNKINQVILKYYSLKDKYLKAFICEKPIPSREIKKNSIIEYKDGFHIVYPYIAMSKNMRYLIIEETKKKIKKCKLFDDIPFINDFNKDVFDSCVVESNGWVMYGSKKHTGQLYTLTCIYNNDDTIDDLSEYSTEEITKILSNRQYMDCEKETQFNSDIDLEKLEKTINDTLIKLGKIKINRNNQNQNNRNNNRNNKNNRNNINNQNNYYNKRNNENREKDFNFAIKLLNILDPDRAYNYREWIAVGWALHNIDDRLLDAWKEWSRQDGNYLEYDEQQCNKVWETARDYGYTMSSLYMWAKNDNPTEYIKLIRESINSLIKKAETGTERHIAKVVHEMYRYEFKCTSLKCKEWFHFQGHRWVNVEEGYTLDTILSEELPFEFIELNNKYMELLKEADGDDRERYLKKSANILKIIDKLNRPAFKDGVMKELAKLFIDTKFTELADSKTNLIGFDNGVYDLDEGRFRSGCPDDYMTFTVGYDYPAEYTKDHDHVLWVEKFFSQVHPDEELNMYLKLLLSSYLDGKTLSEKFIIWTGCGCHAKGTKIMMFDGTLKNVEQIKIGEKLMGDDSTPRLVKQLFRGKDKMYKIYSKSNFSNTDLSKYTHDNFSYIVNSFHRLALHFVGYNKILFDEIKQMWTIKWIEKDQYNYIEKFKSFKVKKLKNKQIIYEKAKLFQEYNRLNNANMVKKNDKLKLTVIDYLNIPDNIRKLFVGYRCDIEFEEKKLDLDPYMFGYWLGNKKLHSEISDKLSFCNILKKYNLFENANRFIPHIYKCNSKKQRLYLLAGIIDAIGYYNSKNYEIKLTSATLADDIIFLGKSLGYKTCKYKKNNSNLYKINIFGALNAIPVRNPNKIANNDSCNENNLLYPINIKYMGEDNYYGFEVDGNNKYLLNDFTCTFNSNGKSKAVEFFQKAFGNNYCGTFNISMLTQKRKAAENASPALATSKGKRFMVFQEPEKNDAICVGYMKELTGGDVITARRLYKEPVEFKPQFKLLLTCNKLPVIPTDDGGTWRRLSVLEWKTKFVDLDKNGLYEGKKLRKNQFPRDYDLLNKIEKCKKALLWLLINVYYPIYKKNKYKIIEPEEVTAYTRAYEKRSDVFREYFDDFIIKSTVKGACIQIRHLYSEFKFWYGESYAKGGTCPAKKDLIDYLNEKEEYIVNRNNLMGYIFKDEQEVETSNDLDCIIENASE